MVYSIAKSLIISDLDGTLLNSNKDVSDRNLKSLQDWTNCGGDFTIATGRSIISASHRIKDLPITCQSVVFNGGILYDYSLNKIEFKFELSSQYRDLVATVLKKYPEVGVEIMTDGLIYLPSRNDIVECHMAKEDLENVDCTFDDMPQKSAIKILFGVPTKQVEDFLNQINAFFNPELFYSVRTDENYCEIMPSGVNKGSGLERLKGINNDCWDCVIAFGDFFNDLPLFEKANFSIATANAPAEVKRCADFVVSSNDCDAIAEGIDLLLKKEILIK